MPVKKRLGRPPGVKNVPKPGVKAAGKGKRKKNVSADVGKKNRKQVKVTNPTVEKAIQKTRLREPKESVHRSNRLKDRTAVT